MGRWSYSNRWTVEDCKRITTKYLKQHGFFDGGVRSGILTWSKNGQETGKISIQVSTLEGEEYIQFIYTQTDRKSGGKTELDYKVRIVSTACNYGGKRWWFICPLIINGNICDRRVGVLYLAGHKYFGCRYCYNLTYGSCKESHKFDGLYRKIGMNMGITAKQVKEALKGGI